MCMGNYIVEPCSIKFLLEHHFDFNRQYSKGLPYYRANMVVFDVFIWEYSYFQKEFQ